MDNNILDPNYILPGQELVINVLTPTPTPMPTPSENVECYIVQPGDTLSDIARRYGVDYNDIAMDNNILDPNYILPGQELVINVLK